MANWMSYIAACQDWTLMRLARFYKMASVCILSLSVCTCPIAKSTAVDVSEEPLNADVAVVSLAVFTATVSALSNASS